jgi:hypothetical protein
MNLSGIGTVRLRGALAAAVATVGLLVAVMAPATGVNEDWPEGALIEAPGEFELPPPRASLGDLTPARPVADPVDAGHAGAVGDSDHRT